MKELHYHIVDIYMSIVVIVGAYGFIWTVLWLIFIKDFPTQHPRISLKEKRYLEATLINETILYPRKVDT